MSHRFPLSEAPSPNVHQLFEQLLSAVHNGSIPFDLLEEDGQSMAGPYAAFSYAPDVARDFLVMAKTALNPRRVKPRNRELAILALCSVLDAPYVRKEHVGMSAALGLLTAEQCEAALAGATPAGLEPEEQAAYELARRLSTLDGPLDDKAWADFAARLSKAEIVGIANVVGGYKWIALLVQING